MAVGTKINSRSKGNRNERNAAKLLATWTSKEFSRTPSSGGLNWKSSNSKGDIVCTTEGHYFPFCIEVKAHREINFQHLLYNKTPKILEFWEQCLRDALRAKKIPLLMMRYDGMPKGLFFIAIETDIYTKLPNFDRMSHCRSTIKFWDMDKAVKLTIIPSTSFFKMAYRPIKKIAKQILKDGN